jgi:hypothetical protein
MHFLPREGDGAEVCIPTSSSVGAANVRRRHEGEAKLERKV